MDIGAYIFVSSSLINVGNAVDFRTGSEDLQLQCLFISTHANPELRSKCEKLHLTNQRHREGLKEGSERDYESSWESFMCGQDGQHEIIYHDQGVLLSPYFGQGHDDTDAYCLWTINTEPNRAIRFWMDYISLDEGVALYAGSEDDMYSAFNGTRPGSPHIIAGPLTVFFNTNGYSLLLPTDGFKMRYMIIPNTIEFSDDPCSGEGAMRIDLDDELVKLSSPFYVSDTEPLLPNNVFCQWMIVAPPGMIVEAETEYFDLEENMFCQYDYLEVRSTESADSYTLQPGSDYGIICGSDDDVEEDFVYYSSTRYLLMTLRSDAVVQSGGFSGNVRAVNASHHHNANDTNDECEFSLRGEGEFATPNNPSSYNNDLWCAWELEASNPNMAVEVTMNAYDIEYCGSECDCDYLRFIFLTEDFPEYRHCGTRMSPTTIISSEAMQVDFESNSYGRQSGFNATFRSISLAEEASICSEDGMELEMHYGSLRLLDELYEEALPCNTVKWNIIIRQFVRVEVTEFDDLCEEGVSTVTFHLRDVQYNLCDGDFYDVTMSRDDVFQVVVNTTSLNNHGAHFTIHFVPDHQGERECGGIVEGAGGSIFSPNYPDSYLDDLYCHWEITVPEGQSVRVELNGYDIEDGFDYVYINDSITGLLLARIDGRRSTDRLVYIASSNSIDIRFTTDGSVTYQGFELIYEGFNPLIVDNVCEDEGATLDITAGFLTLLEPFQLSCDRYFWNLITDGQFLALQMPFTAPNCDEGAVFRTINDITTELCDVTFDEATNLGNTDSFSVGLTVGNLNMDFAGFSMLILNSIGSIAEHSCNPLFAPVTLTASSNGSYQYLRYDYQQRFCQILIVPEDNDKFVELLVEDLWVDEHPADGSNAFVIYDGNSVEAEAFTPLLPGSRGRTYYGSTTEHGLLLNIYAVWTEISFEYRMVDTAGPPLHTYPHCPEGVIGDVLSVGDTFMVPTDSNQICHSWLVEVPEGQSIYLSMSSDQSYCDAQLEVYTVADDDVKTLHSNYCVNAIYNKISVESHRVFLYLNLDYQLTFEGAILQYSTEPHDCGSQLSHTAPASFSLEVNPQTQQYYANTECLYSLEKVDSEKILKINITNIDIEPSQDGECVFDVLSFFDGDSEDVSPRHICGQRSSTVYYSFEDLVLLKFTSDGLYEASGFDVEITEVDLDDVSWLDCGRPAVQPRIVGGGPAVEGGLPWQVGLGEIGSESPFCGGTLVSPSRVITAAHCFDYSSASSTEVYIGLYSHDDHSNSQTIRINRLYIHPDYNGRTEDGEDIAVLVLDSPAEMNAQVAPACLPTGHVATGTECIISGWGDLTHGGFDSPIQMHQAEVPIVARHLCLNTYRSFDETMICAGFYEQGGVDTCQGDSGGPLVCQNPDSTRWELHGVTSWGYGCADARNPGVYANVYHYMETGWLEQYLE